MSVEVTVTLNGAERRVEAGTTIGEIVVLSGGTDRGVAVAMNGDVVPRSAWDKVVVADGAVVEVVAAAAGG